jgi:hypothetical protein
MNSTSREGRRSWRAKNGRDTSSGEAPRTPAKALTTRRVRERWGRARLWEGEKRGARRPIYRGWEGRGEAARGASWLPLMACINGEREREETATLKLWRTVAGRRGLQGVVGFMAAAAGVALLVLRVCSADARGRGVDRVGQVLRFWQGRVGCRGVGSWRLRGAAWPLGVGGCRTRLRRR